MDQRVFTRAELREAGHTRASIASRVASGEIVRARRDRYLDGGVAPELVEAVRVGGRLTCVSLLALHGVFVLESPGLHVHSGQHASRQRARCSAEILPDTPGLLRAREVRRHWNPLIELVDAATSHVGIVDALVHAVRCQPPRAAVATLDSALNKKLISLEQLDDVFAALSRKYRVLRPLVDGRAESGPETLMRLLLRALGCRVELQVRFAGIGRVDLLVDGWLVIECDSRSFHEGWAAQEKDRERDLALAARGFTTLRPTANAIMRRPGEVAAAVRGLLEARSVVRGAERPVARHARP